MPKPPTRKRVDLDGFREVLRILRREARTWPVPVVTLLGQSEDRRPFDILVSTLLSLRTRDETTAAAFARLKKLATTPEAILALSEARLAKVIYPVGFYRQKARQIRKVCRRLIDEFAGEVPDDLDTLLTLDGVGRKTANLVLTEGFRKHGICVDTHVHRITNRMGFVRTKDPDATEMALREKLPKRYWIELNFLLVALGQNTCKPLSPLCSTCAVARYCPRLDVSRSR